MSFFDVKTKWNSYDAPCLTVTCPTTHSLNVKFITLRTRSMNKVHRWGLDFERKLRKFGFPQKEATHFRLIRCDCECVATDGITLVNSQKAFFVAKNWTEWYLQQWIHCCPLSCCLERIRAPMHSHFHHGRFRGLYVALGHHGHHQCR